MPSTQQQHSSDSTRASSSGAMHHIIIIIIIIIKEESHSTHKHLLPSAMQTSQLVAQRSSRILASTAGRCQPLSLRRTIVSAASRRQCGVVSASIGNIQPMIQRASDESTALAASARAGQRISSGAFTYPSSAQYHSLASPTLVGSTSASSKWSTNLAVKDTRTANSLPSVRFFSGDGAEEEDPLTAPREAMPFDVLIVGGGPAGLAASIRIKQLCAEKGKDLSVCVVEKGSEIGAHILSGNVFDPKALKELLPDIGDDWTTALQDAQSSHATPVLEDKFLVLTEDSSYSIPNFLLPSQLHNDGNYVISLGQLCRWLGGIAEEMGVEVYPGFAASEVVFNDDKKAVRGIATRDVGIGKDGKPKSTFERGVELHARQTLFAEGARGSCSEALIKHFNLRANSSEQTYGLGIKEVWEVPEENFRPGFVQHTLGYPLQSGPMDKTFGGTFLYHQEPNLVLAGLVIGLDYANPYINPYQEFQRWKTHPEIKKHFEGGTCISYGARVLNEGGLHSLPKLTFPGGALLGCSAGFLNSVKIKGSHTALKSGMVAAEAVFDALTEEGVDPVAETFEVNPEEEIKEVTAFEDGMKDSWVHDELYEVRNCHEAFKWGLLPGLAYTGIAAHVLKGREPWTLSHSGRDADSTEEAKNHQPISYPSPDGVLTFDLLTNLQRSGTYHDDDQPAHLRIKPDLMKVPESISMQIYAAPEQRFCPAGVYEYVDDDAGGDKKLVINAQNCVHCKCCSIKMPSEYINWTVPEGGGGPSYQVM